MLLTETSTTRSSSRLRKVPITRRMTVYGKDV